MAQHDYDVANGSGAAVRADLNALAQAIVTNNSGTAAPTTTFANMMWYDTTNSLLKIRNPGNTAWISMFSIVSSTLSLLAATVPNDLITAAMMANMAADTIRGRADGAGTGDPQDLTAAQVATILATAGRQNMLVNMALMFTASLNDDTAVAFAIGATSAGALIGWHTNLATNGGWMNGRPAAASTALVEIVKNAALTIAYSTGVLSGTTGTDVRLNFSVDTVGNFYAENRTGGAITIYIYVLKP